MQHALGWYVRSVHHDGCHATWADPTRARGSRVDAHEHHLVAVAIARAIGGLPGELQRVLALYYMESQPVISIADELHRHPSRVYAQLGRARAKLAAQLRAEELLTD